MYVPFGSHNWSEAFSVPFTTGPIPTAQKVPTGSPVWWNVTGNAGPNVTFTNTAWPATVTWADGTSGLNPGTVDRV